ncbi:MAG: DUF6125 family protein [Chloroflexi bacterium]|nr:DUF6125 family protein [Chloroflexota bacterium]
MEELEDYSGEFKPDIRYEDFSKAALARLLNAYCREILMLDLFWMEHVEKRLGEEEALKCLMDNWVRMGKHEIRWAMEALNIKGNNVATYAKALQMVATMAQGVFKWKFDLKNDNLLLLTLVDCPALTNLEKNNPERITFICHTMDLAVDKAYAAAVNPAIQVTPLKLPPRKSKSDIACQWEFKLEA